MTASVYFSPSDAQGSGRRGKDRKILSSTPVKSNSGNMLKSKPVRKKEVKKTQDAQQSAIEKKKGDQQLASVAFDVTGVEFAHLFHGYYARDGFLQRTNNMEIQFFEGSNCYMQTSLEGKGKRMETIAIAIDFDKPLNELKLKDKVKLNKSEYLVIAGSDASHIFLAKFEKIDTLRINDQIETRNFAIKLKEVKIGGKCTIEINYPSGGYDVIKDLSPDNKYYSHDPITGEFAGFYIFSAGVDNAPYAEIGIVTDELEYLNGQRLSIDSFDERYNWRCEFGQAYHLRDDWYNKPKENRLIIYKEMGLDYYNYALPEEFEAELVVNQVNNAKDKGVDISSLYGPPGRFASEYKTGSEIVYGSSGLTIPSNNSNLVLKGHMPEIDKVFKFAGSDLGLVGQDGMNFAFDNGTKDNGLAIFGDFSEAYARQAWKDIRDTWQAGKYALICYPVVFPQQASEKKLLNIAVLAAQAQKKGFEFLDAYYSSGSTDLTYDGLAGIAIAAGVGDVDEFRKFIQDKEKDYCLKACLSVAQKSGVGGKLTLLAGQKLYYGISMYAFTIIAGKSIDGTAPGLKGKINEAIKDMDSDVPNYTVRPNSAWCDSNSRIAGFQDSPGSPIKFMTNWSIDLEYNNGRDKATISRHPAGKDAFGKSYSKGLKITEKVRPDGTLLPKDRQATNSIYLTKPYDFGDRIIRYTDLANPIYPWMDYDKVTSEAGSECFVKDKYTVGYRFNIGGDGRFNDNIARFEYSIMNIPKLANPVENTTGGTRGSVLENMYPINAVMQDPNNALYTDAKAEYHVYSWDGTSFDIKRDVFENIPRIAYVIKPNNGLVENETLIPMMDTEMLLISNKQVQLKQGTMGIEWILEDTDGGRYRLRENSFIEKWNKTSKAYESDDGQLGEFYFTKQRESNIGNQGGDATEYPALVRSAGIFNTAREPKNIADNVTLDLVENKAKYTLGICNSKQPDGLSQKDWPYLDLKGLQNLSGEKIVLVHADGQIDVDDITGLLLGSNPLIRIAGQDEFKDIHPPLSFVRKEDGEELLAIEQDSDSEFRIRQPLSKRKDGIPYVLYSETNVSIKSGTDVQMLKTGKFRQYYGVDGKPKNKVLLDAYHYSEGKKQYATYNGNRFEQGATGYSFSFHDTREYNTRWELKSGYTQFNKQDAMPIQAPLEYTDGGAKIGYLDNEGWPWLTYPVYPRIALDRDYGNATQGQMVGGLKSENIDLYSRFGAQFDRATSSTSISIDAAAFHAQYESEPQGGSLITTPCGKMKVYGQDVYPFSEIDTETLPFKDKLRPELRNRRLRAMAFHDKDNFYIAANGLPVMKMQDWALLPQDDERVKGDPMCKYVAYIGGASDMLDIKAGRIDETKPDMWFAPIGISGKSYHPGEVIAWPGSRIRLRVEEAPKNIAGINIEKKLFEGMNTEAEMYHVKFTPSVDGIGSGLSIRTGALTTMSINESEFYLMPTGSKPTNMGAGNTLSFKVYTKDGKQIADCNEAADGFFDLGLSYADKNGGAGRSIGWLRFETTEALKDNMSFSLNEGTFDIGGSSADLSHTSLFSFDVAKTGLGDLAYSDIVGIGDGILHRGEEMFKRPAYFGKEKSGLGASYHTQNGILVKPITQGGATTGVSLGFHANDTHPLRFVPEINDSPFVEGDPMLKWTYKGALSEYLSVYPNPVSRQGMLSLEMKNFTPGMLDVMMVDALGRNVWRQRRAFPFVSDKIKLEIDLANLRIATGAYMIIMRDANNPISEARLAKVMVID